LIRKFDKRGSTISIGFAPKAEGGYAETRYDPDQRSALTQLLERSRLPEARWVGTYLDPMPDIAPNAETVKAALAQHKDLLDIAHGSV
jgi:hypothetical protein